MQNGVCMLIVAEWINQYLSRGVSISEINEALESAGIEVEGVISPPEFDKKLVVAEVVDVKPHPDDGNLQIAVVSTPENRYEVVCGAPNLAQGQRSVLAMPGSVLPGGEKIKQTEIRGVNSEGMLCSEKELGLTDNHEGIVDLGSEVEAGKLLNSLSLGDYVIIDVTTAANRWDLQSYSGIAREVAAHTGVGFTDEEIDRMDFDSGKESKMFINHIPDKVKDYTLVKLECDAVVGLLGQEKIKRRLRLSGIKSINSVVDATNYAMLATGQPLHAFDASKIKGKVEVRFANKGESIKTLDGVERSLVSDDIVIADDSGPIALAGVIGGADTEVSDSTKEIILESATFPSVYVRKTAQRHGLRTEASSRFERQLPIQAALRGMESLVSMLKEFNSMKVVESHHERNDWPWVQHIGLRLSKARQLTGIKELSMQQIVGHLELLGFEAGGFDIAELARGHLGKPYKLGAKFKTDGLDAFDCSYLIDYLYSLIGIRVGHSAYQQYQNGFEVGVDDLVVGDLLFRGGPWVELSESERGGISHVALYIGDGKIIEAKDYARDKNGEWQQIPEPDRKVVESDLESIVKDPQFVGARRYVNSLDDFIFATVPWWRPDVKIPEDAIEEVIKLIGLEKVPATLPHWHPSSAVVDWDLRRDDEVRRLLYGLGAFEVTTYPFISESDIGLFKQTSDHFRLQNPRSQEQAYLRNSLMPLLVRSVVNNSTYKDKFVIFELAKVFGVDGDNQLPNERHKLGLACQSDDILDLKRHIDALFGHAHLDITIEMTNSIQKYLHPSRQAVIFGPKSEELGWFGVVHPDITSELKSRSPIMYAEIDLIKLKESWSQADFEPLSAYQSSYRDITLEVARDVTWDSVYRVLSELDDVECSFKDEYHKDDKKALTIHVELKARERTLSEDDIKDRIERIVRLLTRYLDAEITL